MPARNRPQSNAMLYTLVTFVGLFIIAAAAAVIFYVKFEDQRTTATDAKRDLNEFANTREQQNKGKIIGAKQPPKTWLGTMNDYLDKMVMQIIGGPSKDTSAEEKVGTVNRIVQNTLQLLAQEHLDIETIDPNTTGLIQIIEKLKTKLDNTTKKALSLEKQLEDLHNKFDDTLATSRKKEQKLLAEKEKYERQVNEIKQEYDKLAATLNVNKEQQVQDLTNQLEQARAEVDRLQTEMRQMGAKLLVAEQRIAYLQNQIHATMPSPDPNALAYQPDGRIILIDNQIVHLNIGSDDRVYRGLTFTVYDRGMPIPKHGRGKAEIEVFDVRENFAAARILHSERRNPIVEGDVIANLIWDRDKTNIFMIAGEFDLDSDGGIEYDAADKIKSLIQKWGGKVTNTITINTDYLVLGRPPRLLRKPTFGEMEIDPLATQKYEASLQKIAHYKQVQAQARALWIPVFSTDRFLHFIGYKALASKPGVFY
ncbi:MAG: BRCT domain-containing protein [Planctomycetota bacterium]